MNNWSEWKRVNADKLKHPKGFEEAFVDRVLSRIQAISPADVIPQYAFLDDSKKNRRIDFMIINPIKGYLLPIELDGFNKGSQAATHDEWNDFLERQNAIIRSFGTLLRYSNLQMLNNSQTVIREITEQLVLQSARSSRPATGGSKANTMPPAPPSPSPSQPTPPPPKPNKVSIQQAPPQQSAVPAPAAAPAPTSANAVSQPKLFGVIAIVTLGVLGFLGYAASQRGIHTDASAPVEAAPLTTQGINRPFQGSVAAANNNSAPQDRILPSQAQGYIGQRKLVCGRVAGSREMPTGLFINFDKPYPDDAMSAVIWREQLNRFGPLHYSDGQQVCVSGMIQAYRGKPQIEVERREQISP